MLQHKYKVGDIVKMKLMTKEITGVIYECPKYKIQNNICYYIVDSRLDLRIAAEPAITNTITEKEFKTTTKRNCKLYCTGLETNKYSLSSMLLISYHTNKYDLVFIHKLNQLLNVEEVENSLVKYILDKITSKYKEKTT